MHSIIDSLPLVGPRIVTLAGGQQVQLLDGQIVVWISVTPLSVVVPSAAVPRFPAILDTGFNYTLVISETQLRDWAGVDPNHLRPYPGAPTAFPTMRGQSHIPREAAVWMHSNTPGQRDLLLPSPPFWMYPQPGILVLPHSQCPRIPLIGTRLIEQNALQVLLDPIPIAGEHGQHQLMVSIQSPQILPPVAASP